MLIRTPFIAALILAATLPALAQPAPNTLTKKERSAGWKLLWDGKTSSGWESERGGPFPSKHGCAGVPVQHGDRDLVAIGPATLQRRRGQLQREMPAWLHFFYKTFYKIFKNMSYINIPKDAGDFSMIDRKVVKELVSLPETEQFLRGLRAWVGFKQTGVDYIRPERMFGVSTNNWRKNIWWAKKAIFSFSFVPLEIMSYAGFVMTLASVLGIIWQILAKLIFYPDTPSGLSTVIILVMFFGGINLLGISFLGEYIAKIFEETKKRPKFIRTKVRKGIKRYNTSEEIKRLVEEQRK